MKKYIGMTVTPVVKIETKVCHRANSGPILEEHGIRAYQWMVDPDTSQVRDFVTAHGNIRIRISVEQIDPPGTIEIVEAPGDLCGNSKRLRNGEKCPGCRACQ